MKMPSVAHKNFKGFTLVELMVVIAIIAALAGIAYPSYMSYIRKADRTTCMSNLRELHKLGTYYAADHRGVFPCSGMQDDRTTPNLDESQGWWVALVPYALPSKEEQPENRTETVMLPKYFFCPSDSRAVAYFGQPLIPASVDTISYTSWTDNSANKRDPRSGIQNSRGQSVAGIPWLTDGIPSATKSVRNNEDFEEMVLPEIERHGGYICVVYADGKVKEISEPTFRDIAPAMDPDRR